VFHSKKKSRTLGIISWNQLGNQYAFTMNEGVQLTHDDMIQLGEKMYELKPNKYYGKSI